ncbi:MAG: uroporphyrinogen decarboxylase [Alphaproteobacteria bacterium]|nr:uroporphyrinogen decarboxylase [Alphaproteobacteria bacterium]
MAGDDTLFIRTLKGEASSPPPIWFMRQAGRYLPEYRATRAEAGSFLDLCYNSKLAAEVTFQPIRRYALDAAILFADILLIPQALGQHVAFEQGEGPKLSPPLDAGGLERLSSADIHKTLGPIYETVRLLRAGLPSEVPLIGFAGAPWTVATYMMAGGSMKDPASLRHRFYDDRAFVTRLIDTLVDATTAYLIRQIDAGAQAIQLFDTWAGGLPEDVLDAVCLEPAARIAERLKGHSPETPIILFPKGVGPALKKFASLGDCDAVGIDFATPWDWARETISPLATVQGGLDPLLVVAGGEPMIAAARRLKETFDGVPYVFNLGHGFTPETPPEHVSSLIDAIRSA